MEQVPQWFKQMMGKLLLLYPSNKTVPEVITPLYWDHLSGYSQERLKKAFRSTVEECKYFPTVANILSNMPTYYTPSSHQLPAPEPEEISEDEHLYRRVFQRYLIFCMIRKEEGTYSGIIEFASKGNYNHGTFTRSSQLDLTPEKALEFVKRYAKPEHWNADGISDTQNKQ